MLIQMFRPQCLKYLPRFRFAGASAILIPDFYHDMTVQLFYVGNNINRLIKANHSKEWDAKLLA